MNEKELTLGIIGTSFKENEYRIPIHPDHFGLLDDSLKKRIFIEKGYANKWGIDNTVLQQNFADVLNREDLFKNCDIILLPKPTNKDFSFFSNEQILWGWPHCVQGVEITQVAINKKMTLIAWESMFAWLSNNVKGTHTFYKNNELAGYCSVLHALQIGGLCGHYGPQKKVAVLSLGSVSRGAVYALQGVGYTDITLFTGRPPYSVANMIPGISHHFQYIRKDSDGSRVDVIDSTGTKSDMSEVLQDYDIIVNGILQDTDRPIFFIKDEELNKIKSGTLIVDISCDLAMGFDFARPTSFEDPSFMVGDGIIYYSVDHTPTYLWNVSSYEISSALLPFIPVVMSGSTIWDTNMTINKSIEIFRGEIQNPKIFRFQNRSENYPHERNIK